MDTRKALKTQTILEFKNSDQGMIRYTIQKEIARGGSCIVYDASYVNNANQTRIVRIKECYPYQLDITRKNDGQLSVARYDQALFETYKQKMYDAFVKGNDLFQIKKISNTLVNTIDLYHANQTIYIVSVYCEGCDLKNAKLTSLKECIRVVKNVAYVLKRMHESGYLYLDVKPENIFLLYGSHEIQLFDFDSLIELHDSCLNLTYKINYTKAYAPVEQQLGMITHLGSYSDVYGLGALLYYLLFDRVPNAFDGEMDAIYDYQQSKYANDTYQNRLYQQLTTFFHFTLAHYYKDRYQNMDQVIEVLTQIEQYADTISPYLISTKVKVPSFFVGRTNQLKQFHEMMKQEHQVILHGIGGIGKSSFVRKYIHESDYDSYYYFYDQKDRMKLFNDDTLVMIHQIQKDCNESQEEYFKRKLKVCKALMRQQKCLIVLDDFDGCIDETLREIMMLECDMIFITRTYLQCDIINYELKAMDDDQAMLQLFQYYLGRMLKKEEQASFKTMIKQLHNHTLLVELIAKQMKYTNLTLVQVNELLEQFQFIEKQAEKIPYHKDQLLKMKKIYDIVNELFKQSSRKYEQVIILKALAYMGRLKIHIDIFSELLQLSSKEDINQLIHEGWISLIGFNISLHPVIQECVLDWDVNNECKVRLNEVLLRLSIKIKKDDSMINYAKKMICYSESQNFEAYDLLLYETIMKLAMDEEAFMLKYIPKLLNIHCLDHQTMYAYDKYLAVLLACNQQQEVKKYLKKLKQRYLWIKNHEAKAIYYEIYATYYDDLLDGYYDYAYEEFHQYQKELVKCIDQAIKHMRKSKQNEEKLITFLISRVMIEIRSNTLKVKKIMLLLDEIEKRLIAYDEDCILWKDYYLACAWFYTYIDEEFSEIEWYLKKAMKIARQFISNDLTSIQEVLIPIANIYCECQRDEKSIVILKEAIKKCEKYEEITPYCRLKQELLTLLKMVKESV